MTKSNITTEWTTVDVNDPDTPDIVREAFERMNRPKDNSSLPPLNVPPPLRLGSAKLYTMKITLLGVEPPVWRRFVAPSFMKLHHFHLFLQDIMGWNNFHLYAFTIKGNRFASLPSTFAADTVWDTEPSYSADDYELCQLIKPGMTLYYEYDFGGGWKHEIIVENDTARDGQKHCFYCVEGERACPPEDCGGVHGYEELLRIISDTEHPEHDEKIRWLKFRDNRDGHFDSEYFDPDVCNRKMKVRRPASVADQKAKQTAWSKRKKQERKRKEAAKKRNRK